MTTFFDANGKKRSIAITFRTLFQCAEDTGYDLINPTSPVEGSPRILSDELLYNPGAVARVLASLCKEADETDDAFFDALDGRSFKQGEDAFWKEYRNFFDQSGRDYLTIMLTKDLQLKERRESEARRRAQNFVPETFFNSSAPADDKTGSTAPGGNSQDSPTPPTADAPTQSASSSAESTTPTRPGKKTSNARRTSTPTK